MKNIVLFHLILNLFCTMENWEQPKSRKGQRRNALKAAPLKALLLLMMSFMNK